MKDLSVGIIGTGSISITHLVSLQEIQKHEILGKEFNCSIQIKGLMDKDAEKINSLKTKKAFNAQIYTTSSSDIIENDEIDLIYICTPTKYHLEYFERAVEAGKHVFIEKPLTFSLEEIDRMISLRDRHDIHVQVGLVLRHCPVFQKFKSLLEDFKDEFGSPLALIFRDDQQWPILTMAHPSTWRKDPDLAGAGCLFEHSIHDVDLIEWFCNAPLKRLSANILHVSDLTGGVLEDSASVQMFYENGIPASLISTWHSVSRDQRRVEFFFENAFLLLDGYEIFRFKTFEYQIKKKRKKLKFQQIQDECAQKLGISGISPTFPAYFHENLSFLRAILS
ncbi:MAG: Gfo/Idh/MocA family protein, partial [Candidatus Helarchaeales archaeon]